MLADLDPLSCSPKTTRAPPPSPEAAGHRPMAGDSQQEALLKLQQKLFRLEKKNEKKEHERVVGMLKSLEETIEDNLGRQQTEMDASLDQVKAMVERAMETLLSEGLAQ